MSNKSVHTRQGYPLHRNSVLVRFKRPSLWLLLIAAVFLFPACSPSIRFTEGPRTGPVVILGDSLAEGYDIEENENFVSVLSERLSLEIVNLGQKGITTAESVARVAEEVLPLNPALVIIELGGNDVLQKLDPASTKANLQKMVEAIQGEEIPILILGVRGGVLSDKLAEVFEDLADTHGLAYVPNILEGILTSPNLRVDNVHPNAAGHVLIADRVEPVLQSLLENLGLK